MREKNKGFTIIELIVYIVVFAILINAITLFTITFTKISTKNKIKKDISTTVYSAIKVITYEIKRANNIYTPTSVFSVHPGQLSLETSQELPSGEEITYIDFYLDDDNRLYIKRENQEPILLISENFKVTNLEFDFLDSELDSIIINLALEYKASVPEYQYSYNLSSSASIRR